jgi:hypothetical protein
LAMESSDLVDLNRRLLLRGPALSPRGVLGFSLFKMVMRRLLGKIIGMTRIA